MKKIFARPPGWLILLALITAQARGWDYENHRVVNQLALDSLPASFPAFVRDAAAQERIAFLSGEPDRWRNTPDLPLKHFNGPDHYIDIEELAQYGLKPESLPVFRYDFISHLAVTRAAQPEAFRAIPPGKNQDRTQELVGLLPWAITENYGKLKSGFSYLKAYQEYGGTAEEIANAQANIIYIMGVVGHYIGDASQPLHTTMHHHGWVGDNPKGYTTNRSIHSWIDGGYLLKVGGADQGAMLKNIRPAKLVPLDGRPARPEEIFQAAMVFVMDAHKLVEPLYQMDKQGKLSGEGETGLQGKPFLENQLVKAGQMLGDLWYSAWQHAPADNFLRGQLTRRQLAADGSKFRPDTK
jgi:hypothetical protein